MSKGVEVFMDFAAFFKQCTGGHEPLPYQEALAECAERGQWPDLLDIPTGLGKTAAVLSAWLWARIQAPEKTPRRLVYCLPVRTLIEQTHRVAEQMIRRLAGSLDEAAVPSVHLLMGGDVDEQWELYPERPAILVGTQDMLLSRALGRGYAMRRSKWPVHFGLLNNDVLWVFDEPQLMGVGVPTGAQLHALRHLLRAYGPTHTLWMSATLDPNQLDTIDSRQLPNGRPLERLTLQDADLQHQVVSTRLQAPKRLERWDVQPADGKKESVQKYVDKLAEQIEACWPVEGLVLIVLNAVSRAQQLYQALRKRLGDDVPMALVHGRMRSADRRRHEQLLTERQGPRLVVATQAIEAGVDVSAKLLVTELAPWPSIVQRCGRCNRYGELPDATVAWIDLPDALAPPYEADDLRKARKRLQELRTDNGQASPEHLRRIEYTPPLALYPALRRKDLLELFDTTPDLLGDDIDVSPFVRHGDESDVFVYYRDFDPESGPGAAEPAPAPEELIRVPIREFQAFVRRLTTAASGARTRKERNALYPWVVDAASRPGLPRWQWVRRPEQLCPGRRYLLHVSAGGYDPELGWLGTVKRPRVVQVVGRPAGAGPAAADEHLEADPRSAAGDWVSLAEHLEHVHQEAVKLLKTLQGVVEPDWANQAVEVAAAWHDVGKAHPAFQAKLCFEPPQGTPPVPSDGPWAKAPHRRSRLGRQQVERAAEARLWGAFNEIHRPYFRHELASALAWLAWAAHEKKHPPAPPYLDLVAYLIAAHHGKVRLSIRSVPEEREPDREPSSLPEPLARDLDPALPLPFARGVWHGDRLRLVRVPGTEALPTEVTLDLRLMRLGSGSWLERTRRLLEHEQLGPFRLGYLESLVRIADWRASATYGQVPSLEEELLGTEQPEEEALEEVPLEELTIPEDSGD